MRAAVCQGSTKTPEAPLPLPPGWVRGNASKHVPAILYSRWHPFPQRLNSIGFLLEIDSGDQMTRHLFPAHLFPFQLNMLPGLCSTEGTYTALQGIRQGLRSQSSSLVDGALCQQAVALSNFAQELPP